MSNFLSYKESKTLEDFLDFCSYTLNYDCNTRKFSVDELGIENFRVLSNLDGLIDAAMDLRRLIEKDLWIEI